MTDEQEDRTIRLLDIIYELYGEDKDYSHSDLPFSISDNGMVILSYGLFTELQKPENRDLLDWAYENIASLFK